MKKQGNWPKYKPNVNKWNFKNKSFRKVYQNLKATLIDKNKK
jgi:hypothetical protein